MEKIDLSFLKTDIDKRILQIVRKSNRIFELNLKKDLERRMEMTKINNKKSVTNIIVAVSAVALITMMSLILFAGCGGTNPVGTWTLDRVVVDGTTYRADDKNKGDYASAFENEIVLNEDETGTVKLDADDATEATWAQTDNVITITADEQELQFTLNGTELIYDTDDGNTKYFYVKKSS